MATRFTTVRVFQDAVLALADDPTDNVVQVMENLADDIRDAALRNARRIIPQLPDGFLNVEVGRDTRGLFVRVTPDGQGRWSSFLTWKEAREHAWLEPAVAEVVGFGGVRGIGG